MFNEITRGSSRNLKVCVVSDNMPGPLEGTAQEAPRSVCQYRACYSLPSYNVARIQLEINVLGLQRAVHPPYTPDLAPLDIIYFLQLKSHLNP